MKVLDAYIIEKIKREQERDDQRVPLHIDRPRTPERPRPSWHDDDEDDRRERGVVIIDL